jgi:hypothetical protein
LFLEDNWELHKELDMQHKETDKQLVEEDKDSLVRENKERTERKCRRLRIVC